MRVTASPNELPVLAAGWKERWEGPDQGLLACWVQGRAFALERPELVAQAVAGGLPLLPWRGGVEREVKTLSKVGSLSYLAMWQGLRGDDLDVSLADDVTVTCARTGVPVRFTPNLLTELASMSVDEAVS